MNPANTLSSRAPETAGTSPRAVWLCALLPALLLYLLTACSDVEWQDSGQQQVRIVTADWHHPRGLAIVHPVHHFLGRFAVAALPWMEPARVTSLLSAPTGAITVANIASVVFILTRRRVAALIAAVTLALSHTFWQHATHTESYSLMAALLSGEWLCLAICTTLGSKGAILLLGLFNGIGVANHLLAALITPIDVLVIVLMLRQRRIAMRHALAAAALWLLGTTPYVVVIALTLIETGNLAFTLSSAVFGDFQAKVLNLHLNSTRLIRCLGYLVYNFPGLTIPLAAMGLFARTALPKLLRLALFAEGLIWTAFAVRYPIPDQYTYFLPVYVLLTLFAGVGLASAMSSWSPAPARWLLAAALATAAWTPIVYRQAYQYLSCRGMLASLVGNKPYSDGYREAFLPWGIGQDRGRRLNAEVARLAKPNGVILVVDSMPWYGLQYAHALGRLPKQSELLYMPPDPGKHAIPEWRDRLRKWLAEGRPVILVTRDRDRPETCVPEAWWKRDGDLYLLVSVQ